MPTGIVDKYLLPEEPQEKVYWIGGDNDQCDVCQKEIDKTFFDAATRKGWGILCPLCFSRDGFGLGTGRGQKYELQPDGKWLKTGG